MWQGSEGKGGVVSEALYLVDKVAVVPATLAVWVELTCRWTGRQGVAPCASSDCDTQ